MAQSNFIPTHEVNSFCTAWVGEKVIIIEDVPDEDFGIRIESSDGATLHGLSMKMLTKLPS